MCFNFTNFWKIRLSDNSRHAFYKEDETKLNKNRGKAIFNWAAKGLFFSEGRGRLYTLRLQQNFVADHFMRQNLM